MHPDFVKDIRDDKGDNTGRSIGAYGKQLQFNWKENRLGTHLLCLCWIKGSATPLRAEQIRIQPTKVNVAFINKKIHVPDTIWFLSDYNEGPRPGHTVEQEHATAKLVQHIQHSMIGKCGSLKQIRETAKDTFRA